MPNIKPVSDLKNYPEILKEATDGAPVFLTQNGYGEYVLLNMKEYERMRTEISLLSQLGEGERSALEKGWMTADAVEAALGL